jgi:hypothetical protein
MKAAPSEYISCVEVGAGLKGSVKGTLDRRLVRATCAAIGHLFLLFFSFFKNKNRRNALFPHICPR